MANLRLDQMPFELASEMRLLLAVDYLCRTYRASVTSWWRSTAHNLAIPGSSTHSKHLRGLAVDVTYDEVPTLDQVQQLLKPYGMKVLREVELASGTLVDTFSPEYSAAGAKFHHDHIEVPDR